MRLLQDLLTELLSNDDLEVSLYSAVVLSHLDQQQDEYTKKLYEVLETSNQQHQSMVGYIFNFSTVCSLIYVL